MGFQEPAPRPQPRRLRLPPAWWVALAIVGLIWLVWYVRRPAPAEGRLPALDPAPSPSAIDPQQAEQIVHLQTMLRQAEQDLADQKRRVAELERQLSVAHAETERHRQGLERAVEQLNQLSDELLELEAAAMAARAQPRFPPPLTQGVAPVGAPHVTNNQFGYVVASGLVQNPTDYPVRGVLEVSLVGSGGVIDTRGFPMTLGAGRTERYDVTFTNIFPTERLGAQARWVE